MIENIAVNASRTTQHCVTLSTREIECDIMAHGAKTLALKAVLDFVQQHLIGSVIDMYMDNGGERRWLKTPRALIAASTLTYASISCGGL